MPDTQAQQSRGAKLQSCTYKPDAERLCYATDELPGFARKGNGGRFVYVDPHGRRVTDPRLLQRFQKLVIPPAWTDVWICATPLGHIQATGRDARGRKQYIYNPHWIELRSTTKFERLLPFGMALPGIRESVEAHLRKRTFSRDAVLAFAVRLMEETLIRVGSTRYERQNQSFGLTTLQHYHVNISGSLIHLEFKGKRGKEWAVDLRDRSLARLARKYQELPGQRLLQYRDRQGRTHSIESADVNRYLRRVSGDDFTAKDFRTWAGTVTAAAELYALGGASSQSEGRKKIVSALRTTGKRLGNTPSVCRKYYIHPAVIDAFWDRRLFALIGESGDDAGSETRLKREERAILRLLSDDSRYT